MPLSGCAGVDCEDAQAVAGTRQGADPPVPLRDKLGAHLLALSTTYADAGANAARAYAKTHRLDLRDERVSVHVRGASEQDVKGLEQRILDVGGSVQSTFENSVFATMPVSALAAFASSEAVWRMDAQRSMAAPTEPVNALPRGEGR